MGVKAVDHPVIDGIVAGNDGIERVFAVAVSLRCTGARAPRIVHRAEETGVYDIVGVKDADGIVPSLLLKHGNHLPQHIALGAHGKRTGQNLRARRARSLLGMVGAVVRDDINIKQIVWIILRKQTLNQMPDDRLLVARCDQNRKAALGRMRCKAAPAAQGKRQKNCIIAHVNRQTHAEQP